MKKISILILFVFTLVSCEDMLDLTPKDSLSDADFWTNETTIQGYVDYAYHMLTEYTSSQNSQGRIVSWGHYRGEACDEAFAHIPWGGGQAVTSGTLNSGTKDIIGGWVDNYRVIRHINIFFDNVEQGIVDVPQDKLDLWMAEMHFLRGYCYGQLIKAFGGVIITDKPFTAEDEVTQTRASYDECVTFIIAEMDAALLGLPDEAVAGRATQGVALGIKSQVLLHAASPLHNPSNDLAKWTLAANAAKAVIDLPQYSLYEPAAYHDVFYHTKSAGNTELMLGKYMNGENLVHFFNYSSTLFGAPSFGGWGLGTPIQNLVDDFQMADGTAFDRTVNGQNPYSNRELRFYENILYDGGEYSSTMTRLPSADEIGIKIETGTYTYIDGTGATVTRPGYDRQGGVLQETKNYTRTGYYCHKYVEDDITTKFQVGEPTQYVMMRLTEFYLNYAECLVMLGKGDEAHNYVLPLRQRVGLPDGSLPAVLTMDDIMHERRVELSFEGHRFFDVRRWKILDQTFVDAEKVDVANDQTVDPPTATYTYSVLQERVFDEKLYYMPIPQAEINKNPLIEQNPGYN
jgi:hypothetical protein